ncbi:MAG: phosphate ABC transporter substrate-binding protein PstS [Gemmatimonadota bacterium]
MRPLMLRWNSYSLAIGLSLLVASCGGPGADKKPGAGSSAAGTAAGTTSLTGAGATFPNPIYTKWFDQYGQATGVHINYQSIGSGGGIRQFLEGTVDFGATDGPMTDEQITQASGNVLHIPTVLGAVVVTYNLTGLGDAKLHFDGPTLASIYLGQITKWNDRRIAVLNPGVKLPAADIIVVHRSDGSGTSFIWTDFLSKVSPAWKSKAGAAASVNWPVGLGGKGNEGVTQQVKQVDGTIGYVELIYAISNNLPYASIKNSAGNFIEPTLESTSAAAAGVALGPDTDFRISITNAPGAQAYPIASFTWLLVRKNNPDAAKGKAIKDFLTWMITDAAQATAGNLHYAPLPEPIRALVSQKIAELQSGSPPAS